MADPVALAALAVEATVGYPQALYRRIGHPVGWFARIIDACERRWTRIDVSAAGRRALGVLTVAIVMIVAAGGGWGVQRIVHVMLPDAWAWWVVALLATPGLAQHSLHRHVAAVGRALSAGDMDRARSAVACIVGRDTDGLDGDGVARAAIESLAESFNDGVAAPLFWLLIGGLPGLYAYKAINTADSLIGHREERFRAFGWAAARTDDIANLVPARIAGALVALADPAGWRVMLRDARLHASPNAGWPEGAMAGVLRRRLGGPVAYDGTLHDKPWLGGEYPSARPADVDRALGRYRLACGLLWVIAGAVAWAR